MKIILITSICIFVVTGATTLTYFLISNSNNNYSEIDKIFNDIKKEYTTRLSDLYIGESSYEINKKVTEDEIGIEDIEKGNAVVDFEIKEMSHFLGKLTVNAKITLNSKSKSKKINVQGFMDEETYLTNKAEKVLDIFDENEHWLTEDMDIDAVNDTSSQWSEVGYLKPDYMDDDFSFELHVQSKEMNTGSIIFDFLLIKEMTNGDIFKKPHPIVIKGYKVLDQDVNYLVDQMRLVKSKYTTSKESVRASSFELNSIKTEAELGIDVLPIGTELNKQIKVVSTDDVKGTVMVDIILEKNDNELSRQSIINNFLSNDMNIVNSIISQINALETTTLKILPSEVGSIGDIVSVESVGINFSFNFQGATIEFKIDTIDDNNGWLLVDAIVSKGNAIKSKKITITSFLTQEEATLSSVLKKISDIKTTTHINSLPSSITPTSGKIANDLGISEPVDKEGTEIEYTILNTNDATGSMSVEVKVFFPTNKDKFLTKKIIINGFSTSARDEQDVNNTLNAITNKNTSKTNINASSVGNIGTYVTLIDLGVTYNLPSNGVNLIYKIISIDDVNGALGILVEASLNKSNKSKNIIISGFKSTNSYTTNLEFSNENNLSINDNLRIHRSYFDSFTVRIEGGGSSFGDLINSYVVELSNGVKFSFGMPSSGNFFSGYSFNSSNEDAQIKAKLYEFVNDTIDYLNFGISQDVEMNITLYGTAANSGVVAATTSPASDNKQIYVNYNYQSLRKYEEKATSNSFNPYFREYYNAITLITHEVGHFESEFALGLFNDDNQSKYDDYFSGQNFGYTSNDREYSGTSVASKLINAFNKIDVDVTTIFSNLTFENGFYQSSSNNGRSGSKPTLSQLNTILSYMYDEDFKNSMSQIFDDTSKKTILNKFDFSNKSVNFAGWDADGDGVGDNSITYSNGKDWFVNNALNQYLIRNVPFEANSTYMFNLHEFLTRTLMLISQKGLKNGATWFGESIWSTMGNMLNANYASVSNSNTAATNATNFINYQSGISMLTSNYGLDIITKEYFNFGGRIGYDNVIKIVQNREILLDEFLAVLYGGFNRTSVVGVQPVEEVYGNLVSDPVSFKWNYMWIIGNTTSKNVSVKWKRVKDSQWKTYTIPQNEYKRIVYRVAGNDRVTSNFYYYNLFVPIDININRTGDFTNYFSNPSSIGDMNVIIQFENSSPVKDMATWGRELKYNNQLYKYYSAYPLNYSPMTSGGKRISFSPLIQDPTNANQMTIKYFLV